MAAGTEIETHGRAQQDEPGDPGFRQFDVIAYVQGMPEPYSVEMRLFTGSIQTGHPLKVKSTVLACLGPTVTGTSRVPNFSCQTARV